MDDLFSCRNCIHNCGQGLFTGDGDGYCLKHNSVIAHPGKTTCKYLHRKDLPHFVVEEGIREHAADFALFPRLVSLETKESIERIVYSERYSWERGTFEPLTHALAQYFKAERRWVFIQAFTGGMDGRRSLAHASLVRHYIDHCGTWTSSYRLVLGLLEEIHVTPHFSQDSLRTSGVMSIEETVEDALWEVVFVRLSAVQEYGWHAGIESLMWVTDAVNGSLAEFDWSRLQEELSTLRQGWIHEIISHAKSHEAFFPKHELDEELDY